MAVSLSGLVLSYSQSVTSDETSTGQRNLTSTVPAGSLLVVTAQGRNTAGDIALTDSKGHTWQSVLSRTTNISGRGQFATFWTITTVMMTTSDWLQATVPSGGLRWRMAARYATGFDTSNPVPETTILSNSESSGTSLFWTGPLLTALDGDLILAGIGSTASSDGWNVYPTSFVSEASLNGGALSQGAMFVAARAYSGTVASQPGGSATATNSAYHTGVAIRIAAPQWPARDGSVTASPALSAAAFVAYARTATATAAPTLTASRIAAMVRSGNIASAPVLSAVAVIDDGTRSGTITAAPSLSAAAVGRLTRTASISAAPVLTATQVTRISPQRTATLTPSPVLTATALISKQTRTGTIQATPTLTGPGIPDVTIPPGPPVIGSVDLRLRAYAPNGPNQGLLPAPTNFRCAMPLNDVPGLTLAYGVGVPRAELLGQPLELAVEVTQDGGATWTEPYDARFLYLTDGRDPARAADEYAAEAKGYIWRLTKARVLAEGALNGEGRREFSGTTGALMGTLWAEAQARGSLQGMTLVGGGATDASGAAWTISFNRSYDVGQDYLSVLMDLEAAGFVDFRTSGREVHLFRKDLVMAEDRTTTPVQVALTPVQVTEAPFRRTWEGIADHVTVVGDEGVTVSLTNPSALRPWGRWEDFLTAGGVGDTGTLTLVGQRYQALTSDARAEYTHGVALGLGQTPLLDYRVGDYVWSQPTSGAKSRYRVRQVTLEKDGNTVQGNVVLNDRFLEADIRNRRLVDAIISGASSSSTGPPPTPPGPDILQPAAVVSLTGSSSTYVASGGDTWGQVSLDWPDVTTNLDGTPLTDLAYYEVQTKAGDSASTAQWQRLADTMESRATLSPYVPGALWTFRVRAVDTVNNRGPWSPVFTVTISADTVGPAKPSTPTATSRLGNGAITWNGLAVGGLPMDADTAYVAVHLSTVNGFTWSAANRFTTMAEAGTAQVGPLTMGATYYGRLVPYDTTGNVGTPSDQFSFAVAALVDVSNFPDDAMDTLYARTAHFIQLDADQINANFAALGFLESGTIQGGIFETTSGGEFRTAADPAATGGIRIRGNGASGNGFRAFGNKGSGSTIYQTVYIDPVSGIISAVGAQLTEASISGYFEAGPAGGSKVAMESFGGVGRLGFYDGTYFLGAIYGLNGAGTVDDGILITGPGGAFGSSSAHFRDEGLKLGGRVYLNSTDATVSAPNLRRAADGRIYVNDNISFGADNSAGTGYKVLRAPN